MNCFGLPSRCPTFPVARDSARGLGLRELPGGGPTPADAELGVIWHRSSTLRFYVTSRGGGRPGARRQAGVQPKNAAYLLDGVGGSLARGRGPHHQLGGG